MTRQHPPVASQQSAVVVHWATVALQRWTMGDVFTCYEEGLARLLQRLDRDHPHYGEALTFEQRLRENIARSRRHRDTETMRAERAEVVMRLNQLALREVGTSFNELCSFSTPTKRLRVSLDRLFTQAGLPPDIPLHERWANLLMASLGQIHEVSFAVVMHLLALLILSGLFAWWLAHSDQRWANEPWGCIGSVWLGLTALPLVAGLLPQRRERRLREDYTLTTKQRVALWLDKAFGAYTSAYLGEMAAMITWLGLIYLDLWASIPVVGKAAYWFAMEWVTFTLSFVGAVIATKYWANILRDGRQVDLKAQHFLLGLGFPVILYPTIMIFGIVTLPFWKRWQSGSLAIALGFLLLAWMLNREAKPPSSQTH
jgi:hypothetical protein